MTPRRDDVDHGHLGGLDRRLAVMAASHVRARRLATAIEVLLPGFVEIIQRFAFLDTMPVPPPPFPEWRIVAADTRGRRHVFTTGEASLWLAVAASCAVPGLFVPIRHDGRRLLDRGLQSTTNADLTRTTTVAP